MANMDVNGLDDLRLSLEEIADLPDTVLLGMLQAEGKIVAAAQRKQIRAKGIVATGQLEASITEGKTLRLGRDGSKGLSVYPAGVRKGGRTRNAEVGFIHEYGAPKRGISPKSWMRTANAEAEEPAAKAAAERYDAWLTEKGL